MEDQQKPGREAVTAVPPSADVVPDPFTAPVVNERLNAFVTGGAYGVLILLGAEIGVLGSFSYSWAVGSVPVTALLLIAVNFAGPYLAGRAMGGRAGALAPSATWTVVVVFLSAQRAEGDLVISGTGTGYLFIIGGMVAATLAVWKTPSTRPPGQWLLGGAANDRK